MKPVFHLLVIHILLAAPCGPGPQGNSEGGFFSQGGSRVTGNSTFPKCRQKLRLTDLYAFLPWWSLSEAHAGFLAGQSTLEPGHTEDLPE